MNKFNIKYFCLKLKKNVHTIYFKKLHSRLSAINENKVQKQYSNLTQFLHYNM